QDTLFDRHAVDKCAVRAVRVSESVGVGTLRDVAMLARNERIREQDVIGRLATDGSLGLGKHEVSALQWARDSDEFGSHLAIQFKVAAPEGRLNTKRVAIRN